MLISFYIKRVYDAGEDEIGNEKVEGVQTEELTSEQIEQKLMPKYLDAIGKT